MKHVLLSVLAFVAISANAQKTFTSGELTYAVTSPSTVEVNKQNSNTTDIVTVPKEVSDGTTSYQVTAIGVEAFRWSKASSITLPETIDSIKESAFNGASITAITLPKNLKYIGVYAFGSAKLTGIDIPASVERIDENAFFGSSSNPTLTQVTLHDGLKYIGKSAFYGCGISELEIPASVDTISATAFLLSKNLKKVTLHDGIKSIGNGAFNLCSNLSDITLPNSLTELGMEAFLNDKALTAINIPANLEKIGECAIGGTSVSTITLDPNNKNFIIDDGVLYTKDYSILQVAPVTGIKTYSVNSKCLGIAGGAFWGNELTSIKLPETLVAIGYGAFLGSQLSNINWPKRLCYIDEQAFANTQFTELTLPETVYFINDGAFAGCKKLTTVNMPSGVTQIYAHAFQLCDKLTTFVANGSNAPTIMDYYETYDAPFYGIADGATLTVPKGASKSYQDGGYNDFFKIQESDIASLTVKSITPENESTLGKYASFSFSVTFNEGIQLVNKNPNVYIRMKYNYMPAYIEPTGDPQWTAIVEAGNTLTVFGNDYDGFMDMFQTVQGSCYYVTIPAGIVKDTTGAMNDQITLLYYGVDTTTNIADMPIKESNSSKVSARFNMNGQSVNEAQKGMQIIRFADGTAKKVLVK